MNILQRIIRKVNVLRTERFLLQQTGKLTKKIKSVHTKSRIYYFCPPTHPNLGDHAQYMCWLRLFAEWYPNHEAVCVPQKYSTPATIQLIKNLIEPNDKIFIHSGYLIFDPHPELHFMCNVVEAFHDKKVTILPQTVNLIDERMKRYVADCFNSHPDLTLMCRDEVSLAKSKELFPNVTLKLMPDVVTSLIGNKEFAYSESTKKGIMFCVRNDGEKFYSDEQIASLRKRFTDVKTDMCDTTIKASVWEWEANREDLIRSMLERFSHYQLIITDRYHGTIFSQIVNTPVIVLSSSDHKLSSGVNWFPKEEFAGNMHYAKDLEEAYTIARDILKRNGRVIENQPYFKNNYYSTAL